MKLFSSNDKNEMKNPDVINNIVFNIISKQYAKLLCPVFEIKYYQINKYCSTHVLELTFGENKDSTIRY